MTTYKNHDLSVSLRQEHGFQPIDTDNFQAGSKWLDMYEPNLYKGWTIIAPVLMDQPFIKPARRVMHSLHHDFAPGEFAHLPLSSLHMTVFPGQTEYDIGADVENMPDWVDPTRPLEDIWAEAGQRLRAINLPKLPPLEVEVVGFEPLTKGASATVDFTSQQTKDKVLELRDAVADAVQWRAPNHDHYRFHITLSYRLTKVPDHPQQDYAHMEETYVEVLRTAGPVHPQPPCFSVFETMESFPGLFTF